VLRAHRRVSGSSEEGALVNVGGRCGHWLTSQIKRLTSPHYDTHSTAPIADPATLIKTPATMNWTGGKLQRSKQASKGITQIQKAHFARARTQLQNNSNALTSPFRPNFFPADEDLLGGQLPSFTSRPIRNTGRSGILQERRGMTGSAPSQHGCPEQDHEVVLASPYRLKGQSNRVSYEKPPSGASACCSSPMRKQLTDSLRRRV